jgi:ribonucleotide monophosphatase NagD (HAD superfamily)
MTQAIGIKDILSTRLLGRSAVLADLDGCLISGETVLADVPELFGQFGNLLWIVSNNSTDTAVSLAVRLSRMGLHIAPDRIFLAGEQTLRRIAADRPGAHIALYAAGPLQELARDLGLLLDRKTPELAILARDPGFDFSDLRELISHLHNGLPIWLTNGDASHPGPDGTPEPETGALFAAVAAAVPGVTFRQLGKPDPYLLDLALTKAGARPDQAIFLGDTYATDGVAAFTAGVPFVLIAQPHPMLAEGV